MKVANYFLLGSMLVFGVALTAATGVGCPADAEAPRNFYEYTKTSVLSVLGAAIPKKIDLKGSVLLPCGDSLVDISQAYDNALAIAREIVGEMYCTSEIVYRSGQVVMDPLVNYALNDGFVFCKTISTGGVNVKGTMLAYKSLLDIVCMDRVVFKAEFGIGLEVALIICPHAMFQAIMESPDDCLDDQPEAKTSDFI